MNIYKYIQNVFEVWIHEIRAILKDQGAILFCFVLPLAYPVLYSWIYNNEVVREVPVVAVDNSHSSLSRQFLQKLNATPDCEVSYYAGSLEEAKEYVGRGEAYGVVYLPADFDEKVGRHEQAVVSVYCDMSYMLTYKAIYTSVQTVSMVMGGQISAQIAQPMTKRDAELSSAPLKVDQIQVFNVTGGYGNSILPGVLVLIIQQAILLCLGLRAGTERETYFRDMKSVGSTMLGKGLTYFMIYGVMLAYTSLVVPRIFGFVMMAHLWDWMVFMTPYLMACIGFGVVGSEMIRYRENVMLTAVCTSVPFLFMSGLSWPQSAIPGFWQGVGDIIPSTFAIRGIVRMSSMGARIGDVIPEFRALCIQAVVYNIIAVFIMYRRFNIKRLKLRSNSQGSTNA